MLKITEVECGDVIRVVFSDGTSAFFDPQDLAEILDAARADPIEVTLSASRFEEAVSAALSQGLTLDSFVESAIREKLMTVEKRF